MIGSGTVGFATHHCACPAPGGSGGASGGGYTIGGRNPPPKPGGPNSGGLGTTNMGLGTDSGGLGPSCGGFGVDVVGGLGLGVLLSGGLGSKDGGAGLIGGSGGGWSGMKGVDGVEVKGGIDGEFGGLTHNGGLMPSPLSAAARLAASALLLGLVGGGKYVGSTVLIKLSLNRALSSEFFLLCLRALASAPRTRLHLISTQCKQV